MEAARRIATYLDGLAARGYFHGAVLVAQQGDVLLREGYGMANLEHQVPHRATSKFRIGSLTKPFTAIAVLQLQEQGLLSVEDSLSQYFSEYPRGEEITLHHLLTHTSGIFNYTSEPEYWRKHMRLPANQQELLARFRDVSLAFEPGTRFRYSNSGYLLLTWIIEKVSGLAYGDYVRTRICEPLQMMDTLLDDGRKIVPHLASGYTVWEELRHAEPIDMSVTQGAYGLVSTVDDLYRLDRGLLVETLLSRESVAQMQTPFRADYGYGWAIEQVSVQGQQRTVMSHLGEINGFVANVFRWVEDDLFVVVLSNCNLTPVTKIGMTLAEIALGGEADVFGSEPVKPVEMSEAERERFVGRFWIEDKRDEFLEVSMQAGRLMISMTKRFGARYRYGLLPVRVDADGVHFVTEHVEEKVVFACDELFYEDIEGRQVVAKRENDAR